MNKEEYYNRVKKTRIKEMTDRTSRDEDYQISCQINYLSKRYIETLENALDEIENILNACGEMACYTKSRCLLEEDIEDIEEIIKKAKGE